MNTPTNFTVFVNDVRELRMRLEAGHRVEYKCDGKYFICEKRGQEYVTACGESEAGAQAAWDEAHERGYHYDWKSNTRVSIPGAR